MEPQKEYNVSGTVLGYSVFACYLLSYLLCSAVQLLLTGTLRN